MKDLIVSRGVINDNCPFGCAACGCREIQIVMDSMFEVYTITCVSCGRSTEASYRVEPRDALNKFTFKKPR